MTPSCRRRHWWRGVLASQSTLCRFEQQANRDWAVAIHELIEPFIRSFRRPPKNRTIWSSMPPLAGCMAREGRHLSGYYDHYRSPPLSMSCGDPLLVNSLRPARRSWRWISTTIITQRLECPLAHRRQATNNLVCNIDQTYRHRPGYPPLMKTGAPMKNTLWIIGAVVIVLVVLSVLNLR